MTDYLYYKRNFKGTIIADKDVFEHCADLALRYIKSFIGENTPYQNEEVSDCICALADIIYEQSGRENIKSESIDGVSITYADNAKIDLYEVMKLYLPKELLYRGI